MSDEPYSIEECILALDLYIRLKKQKKSYDKNNPQVIKLSEYLSKNGMSRNPSSIAYKLGNYQYLDPDAKGGWEKGGMTTEKVWLHYAGRKSEKLERDVNDIREHISYRQSAEYIDFSGSMNLETMDVYETALQSISKIGFNKQYYTFIRVNQDVFRSKVISNFNERCCITGSGGKALLRASHIKPWCKSNQYEKVDVRNGLCLNPFHDVAFDKGLISISEDLTVMISPTIMDYVNEETYESMFKPYDGKKILSPKEDIEQKYLKYHRRNVFLT